MTADEILASFEDDNEMHFHEADRAWIIKAMEAYAEHKLKKEQRGIDGNMNVDATGERICEYCNSKSFLDFKDKTICRGCWEEMK